MDAKAVRLFLNPTAGRGRAGKRQARILELFADAGINIELATSTGVGDLEEQVRQFVGSGGQRLLVAGGDGSVHEAVNGILGSDGEAALGVIPSGTGNDFAKAADIPLNWEHATQLLAERIRANQSPRRIDAGKLNDRYFANGAGIGFDARVTRIARSIRLPVGDIVYLLAIFRAMLSGVATPRLSMRGPDFEWDGPVTLASISNGPWIGGMFHIAPMANNADSQLELLIARPVTRRRILALLPKLMNGTHMAEPDIVHQPVTQLLIQCDEALPSHLDGEVQPLQSEFSLSLIPAALSLL